MDEPTSALDPISTSKIEELTLELKKDYTIVIVTHNICSKLCVLVIKQHSSYWEI